MTDKAASTRIILLTSVLVIVASDSALRAQDTGQTEQAAPKIGANYSGLDERRRRLVDEWVARFNQNTGQKVDPASFYDTRLRLSAKTTFDAVTNALLSTPLTDQSGQRFGDALDIIDRVDMVRGQLSKASGDAQFRVYAQLKTGAIDMLERSREFRRGADNTVFHHGYPMNYRQQGGAPSMQVSIAPDRRRADIDVDYRTSTFPFSMFNGHRRTRTCAPAATTTATTTGGRGSKTGGAAFSAFGSIKPPRATGIQERRSSPTHASATRPSTS